MIEDDYRGGEAAVSRYAHMKRNDLRISEILAKSKRSVLDLRTVVPMLEDNKWYADALARLAKSSSVAKGHRKDAEWYYQQLVALKKELAEAKTNK